MDDRDERQQFNIYLPRDLVRRLKHLAIEEGDSLSRMVERIFEDYLARESRGEDLR